MLNPDRKEICKTLLEVTQRYLIWISRIMNTSMYSAAYAPPCADMSSALLLCQWLSDRSPCANHWRTHKTVQSCQGHEPDGFELQYCKCAHPSNKCKASYYLALCFETSQLSLPFISRALQLGNWQQGGFQQLFLLLHQWTPCAPANRVPVSANRKLY